MEKISLDLHERLNLAGSNYNPAQTGMELPRTASCGVERLGLETTMGVECWKMVEPKGASHLANLEEQSLQETCRLRCPVSELEVPSARMTIEYKFETRQRAQGRGWLRA